MLSMSMCCSPMPTRKAAVLVQSPSNPGVHVKIASARTVRRVLLADRFLVHPRPLEGPWSRDLSVREMLVFRRVLEVVDCGEAAPPDRCPCWLDPAGRGGSSPSPAAGLSPIAQICTQARSRGGFCTTPHLLASLRYRGCFYLLVVCIPLQFSPSSKNSIKTKPWKDKTAPSARHSVLPPGDEGCRRTSSRQSATQSYCVPSSAVLRRCGTPAAVTRNRVAGESRGVGSLAVPLVSHPGH